MKRGHVFLTGLTGAVPVACGMLAVTCAFPTSFEIGFSIAPLVLFCIAAALLLSFWMLTPKYAFGFGALFLAGVILLVVFRADRIRDGAAVFLYRALKMVPPGVAAYFDTEALAAETAQIAEPDLCVSILLMPVSAAVGMLIAYSVLRCKAAALPLLIAMPLMLLGFAYTDQPPAFWTILLLVIFAGCSLVGTGFKRSGAPERGVFLSLLLSGMLVLCALILLFFPESRFEPIPESSRQQFFSDLFGDATDVVLNRIGFSNPREIRLDLPKENGSDTEILFSVRSDIPGTYHLRVRSYGAYSGSGWRAAKEYRGEWRSLEALGNRQTAANATLEIKDSVTGDRIVPYAFRADDVQTDESRIRAKGKTSYSWRYTSRFRIEAHTVTDAEREYYAFAVGQYTMPDGEEKEALLTLARRAAIKAPADPQNDVYGTYSTALAVANYVRGDRAYTLSPAEAPKGEDFVLYFLTDGNEGYCVHFASATTAMLQALGIPARYTSGYYIPNVGTGWRSVTRHEKHAWAEIYLCGIGWVPIESTPSFPPNEPLFGTQTTPSQPSVTQSPLPTPVSTPVPLPTPKASDATEAPASTPALPFLLPTPKPQTGQNEPEGTDTLPEGMDTLPEGTDTLPEAPEERHGKRWLLLLIPVVPALWIGAGLLVQKRREARFSDPNARRSIPEMAFYLKRLERFGAEPDPDAEEWAEEAVFSDHAMKSERKELLKRVHTVQKTVCKDKPFLRFLLRRILFVL